MKVQRILLDKKVDVRQFEIFFWEIVPDVDKWQLSRMIEDTERHVFERNGYPAHSIKFQSLILLRSPMKRILDSKPRNMNPKSLKWFQKARMQKSIFLLRNIFNKVTTRALRDVCLRKCNSLVGRCRLCDVLGKTRRRSPRSWHRSLRHDDDHCDLIGLPRRRALFLSFRVIVICPICCHSWLLAVQSDEGSRDLIDKSNVRGVFGRIVRALCVTSSHHDYRAFWERSTKSVE